MQISVESGYKLSSLKRSTIAISTVVLVEIVLGLAVGSLAIVSDGLHATFDTLTMLVLFFATRVSLEPPDEEHMFGHEKFESIGGLVGGIALIGIALLIMYEAVLKIAQNQAINLGLGYLGFIAIGYTFCVDFFRVGILLRARKSESVTMKAGFYHAIADLTSTGIALAGFGLATLGFLYGDSIASMILSVSLSYLSIRLVWKSGMELSDTISKDIVQKVREEILGTKGVCACEDLKIRKAGERVFVQATVQVPDYSDLSEAHELTLQIEENIRNAIGNAEISIHTHPSETEMPTEKFVENLAKEVKEVKEAHEVHTAYCDGKLYISLHADLDPKLSIEKAHEVAEIIENKIQTKIKDVDNVTVHIEPFRVKKTNGLTADEGEIRRIIHETVGNSQKKLRIERILTYKAGKKRCINIDCTFPKQISIEKAHKIASEIEEKVKANLAETIVTVHMESERT